MKCQGLILQKIEMPKSNFTENWKIRIFCIIISISNSSRWMSYIMYSPVTQHHLFWLRRLRIWRKALENRIEFQRGWFWFMLTAHLPCTSCQRQIWKTTTLQTTITINDNNLKTKNQIIFKRYEVRKILKTTTKKPTLFFLSISNIIFYLYFSIKSYLIHT